MGRNNRELQYVSITIKGNNPKILFLADDPRLFSGVGTITNRISKAFIDNGWECVHLGAAVNPPDKNLFVDELGRKIYPHTGYGDFFTLLNLLENERPDVIQAMTDPRYFLWLFGMSDIVRKKCPIMYHTIWDNPPIPRYNYPYYNSCDSLLCISKLTYNIVEQCKKDTNGTFNNIYCPHGVDTNVMKPISKDEEFEDVVGVIDWESKGKPKDKEPKKINIESFSSRIKQMAGKSNDQKLFLVFWTNKNMRRKRPSSLMASFSRFAEGKSDVALLMHTEIATDYGTDLSAVKETLFPDSPVILFSHRIPEEELVRFYNCASCVINIANAEGFGLSSLEGMSCGIPIINNMTGGLQDQMFIKDDITRSCGIPIYPIVKDLVGSIPTPYINDEYVSEEQVVEALEQMYKEWKNDSDTYKMWKMNARTNAVENFSNEQMCKLHMDEANRLIQEWNPPPRWKIQTM